MWKVIAVTGAAAACIMAAEPSLRLEEVTREALARNPEILAAQKRYEAARQRPSQASSLPDPMLSVGYNSVGSPLPGKGIGVDPVANAGVSVTQPLLWPGKRKLRGDIAEREAGADFEQYRMAELSVVSRAKQSYYRLRNAYASIEILNRNRDLLQKFLRITEARYSVGKAAQQDIFKAQTQLSIIETRIAKLRQEIDSRKAEINALLNRAPDSPLGEPVEVEPQPLSASLDELMAQVRRNAPELRREQKMVERTELALNLARKDYYPDYAVSGGYFYMGSMGPMYMARVDFTLPAYFWRKQRAGVAEQAAMVTEARHTYEAANQMLSFRVKDDYLMAQTSYRLMRMYSSTVIPQSSLALESSLASYETGSIDFLSVLSNFTTVLEYELNYRDELLNYLLALARLEEMTGLKL
jgi:cobalt-zinc-cadmium efflux system outer membrane protein